MKQKEEVKNFALEIYTKILPLEMIKNAEPLPVKGFKKGFGGA